MDLPNHFPVVLPEFLVRLVYTGEAGDWPCSGCVSTMGSVSGVP